MPQLDTTQTIKAIVEDQYSSFQLAQLSSRVSPLLNIDIKSISLLPEKLGGQKNVKDDQETVLLLFF